METPTPLTPTMPYEEMATTKIKVKKATEATGVNADHWGRPLQHASLDKLHHSHFVQSAGTECGSKVGDDIVVT